MARRSSTRCAAAVSLVAALLVADWPDRGLSLPGLPRTVQGAKELVTGTSIPFRSSADVVTLTLAPRADDQVDQIIVLQLVR